MTSVLVRADRLALPAGGRPLTAISKDGTLISAAVFGPEDAPTIVLAHGITQHRRAWAYQVHDLADRFRVVVYDQRGHGRSGRPRELTRFTPEALGEDLQAVLQRCLPAGERAVVAGHSLGGIAIMAWAGAHPAEVRRRIAAAALVNTAPGSIVDHVAMVGLPVRTHRMARMLVRQRLLTVARTGAKLPLRWLALGDVADPVHLAALSQMARRVPSVTLNRLAYSLTGMDLMPCVPALTVPTAVVGGGRDRLLPLVHSERIAAGLPDLVRLISVPGAGHMGPWEARAVVSDLLTELAERYL